MLRMWGDWTYQTKLSKATNGRKGQEVQEKAKGVHFMGNEDDSSTDSDDEEVANICLMANEEK
ncbi:hypothetical protein PIB30_102687, partial [Stylosanthes scabra]|nr:hypothetical protein [Stylosanthes scabra]